MEGLDKDDLGVIIEQTDHVLAVLQRGVDGGGGEVDAGEVHAVLTAVRALLATGMA